MYSQAALDALRKAVRFWPDLASILAACLYAKMVDKPMDRWEKRHPDANPDKYDKKLIRLEEAHDRKYDLGIAAIVRRWGVAPPREEGSLQRRYYRR
jgi:hypothetical protein